MWVCSGSDWIGDQAVWKSYNRGCIRRNGGANRLWSKTQQTVAFSFVESDSNTTVKGMLEAIRVRNALLELFAEARYAGVCVSLCLCVIVSLYWCVSVFVRLCARISVFQPRSKLQCLDPCPRTHLRAARRPRGGARDAMAAERLAALGGGCRRHRRLGFSAYRRVGGCGFGGAGRRPCCCPPRAGLGAPPLANAPRPRRRPWMPLEPSGSAAATTAPLPVGPRRCRTLCGVGGCSVGSLRFCATPRPGQPPGGFLARCAAAHPRASKRALKAAPRLPRNVCHAILAGPGPGPHAAGAWRWGVGWGGAQRGVLGARRPKRLLEGCGELRGTLGRRAAQRARCAASRLPQLALRRSSGWAR